MFFDYSLNSWKNLFLVLLNTTPKIKPFFMQLQKHCYLKFSINLFDFNNFEMLQKPALYVETICVYRKCFLLLNWKFIEKSYPRFWKPPLWLFFTYYIVLNKNITLCYENAKVVKVVFLELQRFFYQSK